MRCMVKLTRTQIKQLKPFMAAAAADKGGFIVAQIGHLEPAYMRVGFIPPKLHKKFERCAKDIDLPEEQK